MIKIGNILWEFYENDYYVGEISDFYIVTKYFDDKDKLYCISTNGIIGGDRTILVPATEDFNTLVEVQYYSESVYYTASESVAVNYIRDHFNETDNQRNIQ